LSLSTCSAFCSIGEQAQGRLGHDCLCACDEWPQQRSGFTTCAVALRAMMRDRMTAHITAWHCARNVEAPPDYCPRTPSSESLLMCRCSFFGRLRAGCEWLEFREAWGFGRFWTFPFYLSDYRDIPMSLDNSQRANAFLNFTTNINHSSFQVSNVSKKKSHHQTHKDKDHPVAPPRISEYHMASEVPRPHS
jgi:hypothetical protein